MPIAGCSSPSDVKTQPASSCDDPTQPCPRAERLTNLTVIEGASVDGVVGPNRWATARHPTNKVVIEATTEPNTAAVWSRLQWSGDAGEAVPGAPNRGSFPGPPALSCGRLWRWLGIKNQSRFGSWRPRLRSGQAAPLPQTPPNSNRCSGPHLRRWVLSPRRA